MHRAVPLLATLVTLLLTISTEAHVAKRKSSWVDKQPCKNPLVRREWRSLSVEEKGEYIGAVKCLQSLPPISPMKPQARSRYDEFVALHITVADYIHLTGNFLPWHRLYTLTYERDLRQRCGFEGTQPYWDWTIDADQLNLPWTASSLFDSETGFGGDGVPGTYQLPPDITQADRILDPRAFKGCVQTGPFANSILPFGPGVHVGDHCLTRRFNDSMKPVLTSGAVATTLSYPTFEQFRIELEGLPVTPTFRIHDGGHSAVGGEMSNFYSNPGDPLFTLHHAAIDRVWWTWQQADPNQRIYEISGPITPWPLASPRNTTLDDILNMGTLTQSVPIRDVMDILMLEQCYTYDKLALQK